MTAENPEELRRKLALLEGDRKAFYENTQATIQQNKDAIDNLRRENKSLQARVKSLKAPTAAPTGPKAVEQMDGKIAESIKKHNALRYQAQAKQQQLAVLQKQLYELEQEESVLQRSKDGDSTEAQRLRELENRLDKATIKAQEAQHIGRTYQQIISKLQQDRLTFDGKISGLEKSVATRKQDLADLQSMYNDACTARDAARKELQQVEQDFQTARAEREAEKKRLDAQAEERRRQYEAIEKRLRLASMGDKDMEDLEQPSDEARQQAVSYEEAMRRIKDATGVSNIQEVVERFQSQGQTREHLTKLKEENLQKSAKLREEFQAVKKQFDAQKYSGDSRNASNQRMLSEFEAHLKSVESELDEAKRADEKQSKTLVKVKAGVDSLFEKLDSLDEVAKASNTKEKLVEAEQRLVKLLAQLNERKEDLPAKSDQIQVSHVLPANNTRIRLESASTKGKDSDSEDDEVISRDAIKRTAQNLLDAKTAKPKKGK